jgi:hypothetical protein
MSKVCAVQAHGSTRRKRLLHTASPPLTINPCHYPRLDVSLLLGFSANIVLPSVLLPPAGQELLCTCVSLLVEDHVRLSQTIVRGLDEFGFTSMPATAEDGINAASAEYEALILDLGHLTATVSISSASSGSAISSCRSLF